ncbi:MAG: glycerophosphodiester phosphodiesterase, partial [Thermoflexus sp.]
MDRRFELDPHALAVRHAPVLLLDAAEPFRPERVGYTVLGHSDFSPTFPRRLTLEPPARYVIEYAIWWDADIGHLYELEHVWVYLSEVGEVVRVEASWHGEYREMRGDSSIALEDRRPVLYVEPGKHALAPAPGWLMERASQTLRECTRLAGAGGIWLSPLYGFPAVKSPWADRLARTYLRRHAFTPTWRFEKRFEIPGDLLVPARQLLMEIPRLLEARLRTLERSIPEAEREVLIIAHRGASREAPPNSAQALQRAAEQGADMVEVDVRVTADGIPILAHDAEIRLGDQTSTADQCHLLEIRGDRGTGQILTLGEALERARALGLGVYLDLKVREAVEPAALAVQQTKMLPFVIFGARDPEILRAVRRVLPWAYTAIMLEELEQDPVEAAQASGAAYVHPCWELRDPHPEERLTR